MASTESSAVIRLINSVHGAPILDSFHEPVREPLAFAPEAPPLQADFRTVMVKAPTRSRWPLFALGGIVLLGGAIGAGYVIGQSGNKASSAQPAAGAVPMLAQDEAPQRAVAEPSQQTEPQAAVAITGAELEQQQVAFDAAFDVIIEPAGATVLLDGKELGPAPLRIGRLAPGAHTLEVVAPEGYEAKTIPLDLISGERQVIRLVLDAVAAETQAVHAGVVAEAVPAAVVEEESSRSFRTKRPERKAIESVPRPEKVTRRSRSTEADKPAKRETAVAKSDGKTGTLMVGSKPPCKIFIDGKDTGLTTPQRAIKVAAGKHKVTLVNQQHKLKATATVSVAGGETKRVIKDMSSRL